MKSIILTYAPVNKTEHKILRNTTVFKLALNQHGEVFCPNARIITDYVLPKMCQKFSQKIISVREKLRYFSNQVEYFNTEFKGSTIVAAIEYLISKKYKEILIVGDNNVNTKSFQDYVNKEIDGIENKPLIYQYTNGNFHLPVKGITEFCKTT